MQQSTSPIGAFTNGVGQMIGDLKGLGDICMIGTALGGVVTQNSTSQGELNFGGLGGPRTPTLQDSDTITEVQRSADNNEYDEFVTMPYPSPWLIQSEEDFFVSVMDACAEHEIQEARDDYEREMALKTQDAIDRAQQAAQDQYDHEEAVMESTIRNQVDNLAYALEEKLQGVL